MSRRATIPALIALLAMACSCGPAGKKDRQAESRLLEASAYQLLDLKGLADLVPPAKIDVSSKALEKWQFHDLSAQPSGDSLALTASGPRPRAVASVDFESSSVRALDVVVGGLESGRVSLFWAAPNASFGPDRVAHVRVGDGDESGAYQFNLADHQTWNGPIARLRLDLPVLEGATSTLDRVDIAVAEDILAPLTDRPWAIAFGRELRSANLVTPTSPLNRELELDEDATAVSFAYGLLPGDGCAVALEVSQPATWGAPTTLFTHLLRPGAAATWHQGEFEVQAGADRTAVEFSARVEEPCVSSRAAVALGTLRVLRSKRDPRPSIVFISIDTLRPDHLGLHGYARNTSPFLDTWTGEHAVVFEDAWANAAWTLPSHASMLTGQTALRHGVNSRYPAPSSLVTLAETLRGVGYRTAAWTGGSWLSPKYGLHQGFDEFRWWTKPDGGKEELSTQLDEVTTWLGTQRDSPVFLFLHTYEVHSPYRPRKPYFANFTDAAPLAPVTDRLLNPFRAGGYLIRKRLEFADGEPVDEADYPRVAAAYDSAIAYTDSELARLVEAIELYLGDNVVVLLTSDHGEALGEEGRVSHGRLEDEDLRIPWLLRLPDDRAAGTRISARVSSVDIAPTLLELAGLAEPELDGESVLPLIDGAGRGGSSRAAVESYAASSNLGLSLRLRNGGAFLFNDTPWAPRQERERWLGSRSEDPELLARLRAQVVERLTNATGLHLLAWNDDPEPLVLDLLGPCVHPLTVKLTDPDDPELVWIRPKHARWSVPAGTDMRIRIDTPIAPCLTVEVSTGKAPFRFDIDPRQSSASWSAGRVDGTWQTLDPGSTPTTGVSAWLKGPVDATFSDPTGDDAELMEQLRTLGYLQ